MAGIKTIVFDYGGVISHPQRGDLRNVIAGMLGFSPNDFMVKYYIGRGEYDRGVMSGAEYWRTFRSDLEEEQIEEIIRTDVQSWLDVNVEILELIEELSDEYTLAILSNMTFDTKPYLLKADWIRFFDNTLFSCDLKDMKPNSSIYTTLSEVTKSSPEEIIFIDDSPVNVKGAVECGINGIVFKNAADLKKNLRRLLNPES